MLWLAAATPWRIFSRGAGLAFEPAELGLLAQIDVALQSRVDRREGRRRPPWHRRLHERALLASLLASLWPEIPW